MIKAKYFSECEFNRLSPACSLQDMAQDTMTLLDQMRALCGFPLVLTSAFRTKEWDKQKGRSGNSAHTRGKAVDIRCNDSAKRLRIIQSALAVGFNRIGIGSNFIHVDNDTTLPQNVMWHYY